MFGAYLVDRGLITPVQLLEALEKQKATRITFGRVAYQESDLTLEQVLDVLEDQPERKLLFSPASLPGPSSSATVTVALQPARARSLAPPISICATADALVAMPAFISRRWFAARCAAALLCPFGSTATCL